MSSNTEFGGISFDLPKNNSNVIKVIGVGGGGSNAINHMFQSGINGVDFVICNTDAQALQNSPIPNKIQLGVSLTEGLGAGANPDVGEQSAIESYDEIKTMLGTNTKMIFITAGMGGGTGTGAAPIIARMAKELDVLTVGIVTIPFQFEGKMRNEQAQIGVEKLRKEVDSLIVINNNKLREVYGNLGFKAGFAKADEVLATAAKGIAEVITHHYTQNIDLRDAKTVLANSGSAIMGSASATGNGRAKEAIVKALDSPLLNDNKIAGAKNVLLLIISGTDEITLDEIGEINDHIQTEAGFGANIIMGVGDDETLSDSVSVTIIATGFDAAQQDEIVNTEAKKIIHTLDDSQAATQVLSAKNVISPIELPKEEIAVEKLINKVVVAKVTPEEPIIVHNLFGEEMIEETIINQMNNTTTIDLIPTTDLIKEIEVVYNEVNSKPEIINQEFIINDISNIDVIEEEVVSEEVDQNLFSFDMPMHADTELFVPVSDEIVSEAEITVEQIETVEKVVFNLEEDTVEDIEVNSPTELVSVTEHNEEGIMKYTLDVQEEVNIISETDPEAFVLAEKVITAPIQKAVPTINSPVDPFDVSIEESIKLRADERKRSLEKFNYKFRNNVANNIDEIEKQPAYKRMGIDIDTSSDERNVSRTTIGTDSNDDIQLRSNNSFLHDNVD